MPPEDKGRDKTEGERLQDFREMGSERLRPMVQRRARNRKVADDYRLEVKVTKLEANSWADFSKASDVWGIIQNITQLSAIADDLPGSKESLQTKLGFEPSALFDTPAGSTRFQVAANRIEDVLAESLKSSSSDFLVIDFKEGSLILICEGLKKLVVLLTDILVSVGDKLHEISCKQAIRSEEVEQARLKTTSMRIDIRAKQRKEYDELHLRSLGRLEECSDDYKAQLAAQNRPELIGQTTGHPGIDAITAVLAAKGLEIKEIVVRIGGKDTIGDRQLSALEPPEHPEVD